MKRILFLAATCCLTFSLLAPTVSPVQAQDDREVARARKTSSDHLRQQVLAMHNYHGDYVKMPAHAMYDKAGTKALLSWRVMILPYLEEDRLFKKFKLDEPWDSTHNKALLKEMPAVYAMPGIKNQPGMTHYQVFTMPATAKGEKAFKYAPIFSLSKNSMTLGQITVQDGCSNTICIVEAGTPVEWTKPVDIHLENDNSSLPGFGIRPKTDEFLAAFADGSVHQIRLKIDDMKLHTKLMKQLIGRNDSMNEDASSILKD